jgi:predicted Rossmann fold nucleotide-binding protein DprA/Smf involved in DNA uptake
MTLAEFVDSTVKDIDERLRELKDEVRRLEAARSALTSRGAGRPRGATAARARRRGPGRPRARRGGTRADQALRLVRSKPGITIPEIASSMKIQPNYLYRVLPKLEQNGDIKKDGKGWAPA